MTSSNQIEKSATMTSYEKKRYVKYALLMALAAAGIGSASSALKSKREREKKMNPENSKNVITVPIKKTKFMEGLPTPDQLAESRGEVVANDGQKNSPVVSKELPPPPVESVSNDDIEAKKRAILRGAGRKIDFFGKKAYSEEVVSEKEIGKEPEIEELGSKSEKKDVAVEEYDGRTVLRDQSGRFVSPTDPVAVKQEEKKAGWLWDTITSPGKSIGMVAESFKEKPLWYTAGALGSVYIAAKISEAINENRRERSKRRLENAREDYIDLLQGSEKAAEDPREIAGSVLGAAFFVPAAITALVTNRIIANRRAEKKKMREMSDSYPDDPVILYKTAEGKDIKLTPEAALALISIKTAMVLDAELSSGEFLIRKSAQAGGGVPAAATGASDNKPFTVEQARDWAVSQLVDEENDELLRKIVDLKLQHKNDAAEEAFKSFVIGKGNGKNPDANASKFISAYLQNQEKIKNAIAVSNKLESALANRLSDSRWDKDWGPMREREVKNRINGYFGLSNDSWIGKIISWIVNNTGLGRYFSKGSVSDMFSAKRKEIAEASQKNPSPADGDKGGKMISWIMNKTGLGRYFKNPSPADGAKGGKPAATGAPVAPTGPVSTSGIASGRLGATNAKPATGMPIANVGPTNNVLGSGGLAPAATGNRPAAGSVPLGLNGGNGQPGSGGSKKNYGPLAILR